MPPKAGLEGVAQAAKAAGERGLPPVHLWHPAPLRRDRHPHPQGRGVVPRGHADRPRGPGAPVLDRAAPGPDGYHLVTPVEKMKITVEDAPFIATRVDREGDALIFQTNVGDTVEAGP
jgi:hypothetical protein